MEPNDVKDLSDMIIHCVKSAARELHVQRVKSANEWITCEIVTVQWIRHVVTICAHDISLWANFNLFVIGS